jgi:hypothetical protein
LPAYQAENKIIKQAEVRSIPAPKTITGGNQIQDFKFLI